MAESANLLSWEQLAALAEGVGNGAFEADTGYNLKATVVEHDLATEDSSLGINVATLDMINERLIRLFRLGLLETLRSTTRINPAPVRILKYGEYLAGLKPPLSVNVIRMPPLRGHAMVLIEQSVVFSSLDNFFGGGSESERPSRAGGFKRGRNEGFTPTEARIVSLILGVLFGAMKEAWAPVLDFEFEHVSSEINPQFAQIADEDDLVILSRFDTDPSDPSKGFIDLVFPYTSLKPIREALRSRVQTGDGDEESDKQWQAELNHAVGDAPVEVRVVLGQARTTVGEFKRLGAGDVLYFSKPDHARVVVSGISCFEATVGSSGPQVAIRIERAVSPPASQNNPK